MKINLNFIKQSQYIIKKTLSKNSKLQNSHNSLPTVAVPLVLYYIGENSNNYANDILTFMKQRDIKIPTGLKPDPSDNAGFNMSSKNKIRKALEDAAKNGDITEEEKLKYTRKIPFTGKSDRELKTLSNDISDTMPECDTISDKIPLSINIPDNIDFKQLDVSLPPDLQRAVDMSSIDSGDDLISTMFDYVPEDGYDLNKDLFDNFKEMLENLY